MYDYVLFRSEWLVWAACTFTPYWTGQQCNTFSPYLSLLWCRHLSKTPSCYGLFGNLGQRCNWRTRKTGYLCVEKVFHHCFFSTSQVKFAYKPTGSTTAALVAITHHVTRLLESLSYVRCILIDYSKAFDSINHPILFQKLLQLNIPPNVLLWIINFLSSRTQAVSGWLLITQSIIQGSGIGPYLYMIYASDLRSLSPYNVIVKYADDTTLLVGQHSSTDITQEYENISSWSVINKLTINIGKTKEIVFHRPASRHLNIPPPLLGIERVTETTLLGIDITSILSTSVTLIDCLCKLISACTYCLS